MQMFQRAQQLCGIEPTPFFAEPTLSLQMMEELSTVDKGENEVELLGILERELEGDDEGVVDLSKHRAFGECVSDFRARNNVGFANGLERVDSRSVFFANLHDLEQSGSLSVSLR